MNRTLSEERALWRYFRTQSPASAVERFDTLTTDEERRTLSLADRSLPWIAGFGFSRYRRPHPSLDLHVHPGMIEIHCCLTGFLEFEIDGRNVNVLPGEVCLTQPACRHRLVTNAKGHSHYWLLLKLPSADKDFDAMGIPADEAHAMIRGLKRIRRNVFSVQDDVREAFRAIFEDLDASTGRMFKQLSIRTDILKLLLLIVRDANRDLVKSIPLSVRKAAAAIRAAPEAPKGVSDLEQSTGLNRNALTRGFKRLTGLPPKAYALSVRIEQAKDLLTRTTLTATSIANRLGFASLAHFSAQFHQYTGLSPSKFRARERLATL